MHLRVAFLLLFLLSGIHAFSQIFHPPVTNYTPVDYGKQRNPENWCIAQDHRGVMYFGNAYGVITYDGTRWGFVPVTEGSFVTSLHYQDGIVYAGASGEFGFIAPSDSGKLVYHSLAAELPEEEWYFGSVWEIHPACGSILFQAEDMVALYDPEAGTINTIFPETSFHTSFSVRGEVWLRERDIGLVSIDGCSGSKTIVSEDSLFKDAGIFSIIDFTNKIWFATQSDGIFQTSGNGQNPTLLEQNDSALINSALIYGGTRISEDVIALYTSQKGVILLDREGRVTGRIDKSVGLRVNDVKDIFMDRDRNLWIALSNGIANANYYSPLSFFGDESGISGNVQAIMRHAGELFVGTSTGLYSRNPYAERDKRKFAPNKDIPYQVWDLHSSEDRLLIGTGNGLYRWNNGTPKLILQKNTNTIDVLDNGDIIITGADGVFILNAYLELIDSLAAPNNGTVSSVVAPNPLKGDAEIWAGLFNEGVFRINRENGQYTFDAYNDFDGLIPGAWTKPFLLDDEVVFGSPAGLLTFIDEEIVKQSLDDSLKDDPDYYRGYFDVTELEDSLYLSAISLLAQGNGRTWACIDEQLLYFENGNAIVKPFMGIGYGRNNQFYLETDGTMWVGTADGLIRYQEQPDKIYQADFTTIFSRISVNERPLMEGVFGSIKEGILLGQKSQTTLDYSDNSITFEFAAPFFENDHPVMYSWKLEGHDNEWTEWSTETKAVYTNLYEGDYTFLVKARNVFGVESEIAQYEFSIETPWFRTTLAYIGYGILAILLVFIAIRISVMRLKAKNIKLERIVSERTAEIAGKNKVLEIQRDEILEQKNEIQDSINYAWRIQDAILPTDEEFHENLSDAFVLFRPKDVVSGDFYWFARVHDRMVVVCADCTGHGVPGAFMSMIGSDKLNQAVKERKITDPGEILSFVNQGIKFSLKQDDTSDATRDGMDAAICTIDLKEQKLYYAGAHRPLWIVENNELSEITATKSAVGGFTDDNQQFEVHTIDLKGDLRFYMTSDGYADQFGGPKGKKLKVKTMKEFILSIQKEPMKAQEKMMEEHILGWMNDEYEQIDDICVIGFRLSC